MKTIPVTIREVLIAAGAITRDEVGALIFAGLTESESQFFVAHARTPPPQRGFAEDLVYNQLRQRHLRARMIGLPPRQE
ncbi:hypothetical protein [Duganella levis]|uniref:Uncharacterized protein n=1 Tax=Duganella levis TaxID=2692169 RepID=A0ABW9W5G5_9BURK|nr:hypothetical protein [Duganella levis]MYN29208.1 hypothetical protein [Duganella levis]